MGANIIKALLFTSFLLFPVGVISQTQSSDGVSYGILLDNSGSMRRAFARQKEIVGAFIKHLDPSDQVSIFGLALVSSEPPVARFAVGLECSSDKGSILKQIDAIGVVAGQTAIFDAIRSGVERIGTPASSDCTTHKNRVLIVITDGEDRASSTKPDKLLEFVKSTDVKLYVIGMVDDLDSTSAIFGKSTQQKAKDLLRRLASDSGGRIVFSDTKSKPDEIVASLFK